MRVDDCNGYGLRDGKLLFVADVSRGLACGCTCLRCGQKLIAKKGPLRLHHFSHYEITNCVGAAETVLHRLAKELLAEMDVLVIPEYSFLKKRITRSGALVEHHAIIAKGGNVRIDHVRVEEGQGDFVPDIVVESGAKALIVEVAVTHKVTRAKLRRIRRRNLPAIEIQLDSSDSLLPRESLKSKLKVELTSKAWLFHPDQRDAERNFFTRLRSAFARDRARIRQSLPLRRPVTPYRPVAPDSFGPRRSEYDLAAEQFHRIHHRYPTAEECVHLWPKLWKP